VKGIGSRERGKNNRGSRTKTKEQRPKKEQKRAIDREDRKK
jgi:hypothetical protein